MTPAEEIFADDDRPRIPVKAWGKSFFVRPMTGSDRDSYDLEMHNARKAGADPVNWRSRYLVRCLVDEAGARIFTDEQADQLGTKNSATIGRLYQLAEDASQTGADAVEQSAKNS